MTSVDYNAWHLPVLLEETREALAIKAGGLYIDMTAGGGGHSAAILERLGAGGRLYAADRDPDALRVVETRLGEVKHSAVFETVGASFSDFPAWLDPGDLGRVDGLLADLGVSSHQLDRDQRGFSYLKEGPLDMRMDQSQGKTAADILAAISQDSLVALLRLYGEESYAHAIASAIIRRREERPITSTLDLASIVASAVPSKVRREGNPARKTFQALRMEVNREQEELAHLLIEIPQVMTPGGRVALISFHSLEDRMVKQAMRRWQDPCDCPRDFPHCICGKKSLGRQITGKPLEASPEEVAANPRARSAKLRVFEFEGEAL